MTDIYNKLHELGIRPLKGDYTDLNQSQKAQIEAFNLPVDYKDFLIRFPQTSVFDKEVCFYGKLASPSSDHGEELLEVLFADCDDVNNNLFSLNVTYSVQIPRNLFVIGEVTGGNLICLDSSSGNAVKLWDKSVKGNIEDCLFDITDNFQDFILLLREQGPLTHDLDAPQLLSFSMSEDLRTKAAEFLKKNRQGKACK
jgi:hypothetical protein